MTEYPTYKTLIKAIREQGFTCKQLAEGIGKTAVTFSLKCHGKVTWTLDEIYAILKILRFSSAMIPILFPPRDTEVK